MLFSLATFGQLSSEQWDEQAKTNIRLLPKYGLQPKTEGQKQSDENFINETMKREQFNMEHILWLNTTEFGQLMKKAHCSTLIQQLHT